MYDSQKYFLKGVFAEDIMHFIPLIFFYSENGLVELLNVQQHIGKTIALNSKLGFLDPNRSKKQIII